MDLLAEQRFARLGCHADGKTYVVPISYALDGERLVGQTTPGLKIDLMRANPHVCIEVDDVKSLTDWRSAILWGTYKELEGIERVQAMGLLIDRYGATFREEEMAVRHGREIAPPRFDGKPMPVIVYCIQLGEWTGRFEREPNR